MRRITLLAAVLFCLLCAAALAETKYEIEVDATNQIVTIFRGSGRGDDAIERQMICSTGKHMSTPKGRFHVYTREKVDRQEWYYISKYRAYVQYPTRFYNDYLFHSLPYHSPSLDDIDETALSQMGTAASHGCIRLYSEDAKWIAENCEDGTPVRIYTTKDTKKETCMLLKARTYCADDWVSYAEYCGYSERPGVVNRNSSAEDVMALKQLLRDWGYFGGEINGSYNFSLLNLIYGMQAQNGMTPTGLADEEFRAALAAGAFPVGTATPLTPGMSGAAVLEMQKALSTLGYYTGALDGEYGEELLESLRLYLLSHNLKLDKTVSSDLQSRLRDEAASLDLPEGAKLTLREVEYTIGAVKRGVTLAVRQTYKRDADVLAYAKGGEEMILLEPVKNGWAHVRFGKYEGFVLSDYLDISTRTVLEASYE